MKVKVRKWPHAHPDTPALDAFILWKVGRMPFECYERIARKHGKEHWLYRPEVPAKLTPSPNGKECLANGTWPGYVCQCAGCDFYETCFPDWEGHKDITP